MAFDIDGKLYVAVLVQGDITVLDTDGSVARRIALNAQTPTNVAFDVSGKKQMLVTEASRNVLILIDTEQRGLPLYK